MPALPWTTVEQPATGTDAVVLASRLELGSLRHVPAFFRAALAVRRQVRGSAGALGVALNARPSRRSFWTLSAWVDQEALDAFVRTRPHADVMRRFRPALRESQFTTWKAPTDELPVSWDEAERRLAEGS